MSPLRPAVTWPLPHLAGLCPVCLRYEHIPVCLWAQTHLHIAQNPENVPYVRSNVRNSYSLRLLNDLSQCVWKCSVTSECVEEAVGNPSGDLCEDQRIHEVLLLILYMDFVSQDATMFSSQSTILVISEVPGFSVPSCHQSRGSAGSLKRFWRFL